LQRLLRARIDVIAGDVMIVAEEFGAHGVSDVRCRGKQTPPCIRIYSKSASSVSIVAARRIHTSS
jgi:hypothetical protein